MKSNPPVQHRATKIVVTLGPVSSDPQLLEEMIRAGVNVVRLNFSHGTAQDHRDRAALVRAAAERLGVDGLGRGELQGPKMIARDFDGKELGKTLVDAYTEILHQTPSFLLTLDKMLAQMPTVG